MLFLHIVSRTLELCLTEVSKCHLFVGILGNRYGWTPDKCDIPSAPEFDWVREYPAGASATELEIYLAALAKPAEALEKTFFYFRSSQFLRSDGFVFCLFTLQQADIYKTF